MLGKGKLRPCDVVGVVGALPVSQDMAGLEKAWALAYPSSTSCRGSVTSRSGVESPDFDTGESSDSDGGNGDEAERG